MKILLLQDVKKVGKRYDIKDVNDGYARNFLIPKKLAVPADEKAMAMKLEFDAKEKSLIDELKKSAASVKKEILEFRVRTGSKGEVFGSVDSDKIKKTLLERGYGEAEVKLEKPLRGLNDSEVELDFGRGVKSSVKVRLLPQL